MKKLLRAAVCLCVTALIFMCFASSALAANVVGNADYSRADSLCADRDSIKDSALDEFLGGCGNINIGRDSRQYDYFFSALDVKATLNADRSIDIVETCDVYFNVQSHGIMRYVPRYSSTETYQVRDLKVEGAPYAIDYGDTLRIGDANSYVTGEQRYVISYTLAFYDDFYEGYDRMYIDLVGEYTDVPIYNFTASVNFPDGVAPLDYIIYSGAGGREDNEYINSICSGGTLYMYNSRALDSYCAVTLDMKLEEGAFSQPSSVKPDLTVNSLTTEITLSEHGKCKVTEIYDAVVGSDMAQFYRFVDDYNYSRESKCAFTDITAKINGTETTCSMQAGSINVDLSGCGKGEKINLTISYTAQYLIAEGDSLDRLIFTIVGYDERSLIKLDNVTVKVNAIPGTDALYVFCGDFERYDDYASAVGENTAYRFDVSETAQGYLACSSGSMPVGETVTAELYFDSGALTRGTRNDDYVPPAMILCLMFIVGIVIIFKNEHQLTPTIEFFPPDKLNPAEVGYIIDGEVDDGDITSLIYYWASHGHLAIE
ncbi:MAG: DUF2207 domain-containing protein, partial [Clostridia bacterium]|nr:DUF2207 domain-containing protein [Clostridia bacterium]